MEKRLFTLDDLMGMYNKNDIQKVVALEKKMINFLTEEQLEEIAKCEKEILGELVNAKMSYEGLQQKYGKVADKLQSIGININDIVGGGDNADNYEEENEDYDEEDFDEEDFDEEEEDYED